MFPSSMSAYMTQHGRILSVVSNMSYYQYQQDDMSYYQPQTRDMSSYVAVQGVPRKDNCNVFGLTPQEVRYLRVSDNINTNYFLLLSNKKTIQKNLLEIFPFLKVEQCSVMVARANPRPV